MGHGSGPALFHRQARLGAIQRLNLRFLIERQHNRVVGRVQVEAHDVDQLVLEVRVVGDLEGLDQVGLQPPGLPLPLDGGPRQPAVLRHRAVRPMGSVGWGRGPGVIDHLVDLVLGDHRLTPPALVHLAHPTDPIDFEVLPPLENRRA